MKKYSIITIVLCLCLSSSALIGCEKKEQAVISVEESEEAAPASQEETTDDNDSSQQETATEETSAEADVQTEIVAGTILGVEEYPLVIEGEEHTVTLSRIQGSLGYTIAFDPEKFTFVSDAGLDTLESVTFTGNDEYPNVFLSVSESPDSDAAELADGLVLQSDYECLVEDTTIGEGEYPATHISYAEGTEGSSRTSDMYVIEYQDRVILIEMDCFLEATEGLGATQQLMLSTLRFE